MKIVNNILILLVILANTTYPLLAQEHRIMIVAHRGDWRNAPENSLQAIRNCIEMGVDMVEIDLKKTKDEKLVLLHDDKIDRTMTGKGIPSDFTLMELKAMRLKNGAGNPTRHQIPTLEEAMLLAKGKIFINIDKGYNYYKDVVKILKKTGTLKQVIIKSNLPYEKVIFDYPNILDEIIYMPVLNADDPNVELLADSYLTDKRVKIFEINFSKKTQRVEHLLKKLKTANRKIWINTLWPHLCDGMDDDRAVELGDVQHSWQKIIELGADYIQTDRPQALINYLEKIKSR